MSAAYWFLSKVWSGVAVGLVVGVVGWWLARSRAVRQRRLFRWSGGLLALVGLLLTAGGLVAIARRVGDDRRFPPMGRLVDVGGGRMHILAEGESRGRPTVVWMPGGHAPGLAYYHLHQVLRNEARSILFDRFGTGWSDVGPFPRRTAREAEELVTLLERAGERGPFVLVGHSYGGLQAVNVARRYPDRIAAVVLLDPTPPDALIYAPIFGQAAARELVRQGRRLGFNALVGRRLDPDAEFARDPATAALIAMIRDRLRDVQPALDALNARPGAGFATASIFEEFTPAGLEAAPDLVVYDGELGALPVYLVIPRGDTEEMVQAIPFPDEAARARALNFFLQSRLRYLAVSRRTELVRAPAGSGHNYPYQYPEFVLGLVRRVLDGDPPPERPRVVERYVTSPDSVRLWYRVVGEGSQTVIVGAGAYHRTWLDSLAGPDRRLVLYDTRGRGQSDTVPPSKVSLDRDLADLDLIRRTVAADSVALVGWSALGVTDFVYALRNPGRVTRLVLLAPQAPRWDPYWEQMRAASRARVDSAASAALAARVAAGEFAHDQAGLCRASARVGTPAGFADPAMARLAPDVCDSPNEWPERYLPLVEAILGSMGRFDHRADLGTVAMPRLVIHGEADNIPLAGNREWVAGHANARLLVIRGAGHWPQIERHHETIEAIRSFLDGQWPSGARTIPRP